jgi:hypothetical protein
LPRLSGLNSPSRWVLLVRPDCGLCETFEQELSRLARTEAVPPIELVDVDSDPELARRYGLDIPVLLWDGVVVCRHQLDQDELRRLLRPR